MTPIDLRGLFRELRGLDPQQLKADLLQKRRLILGGLEGFPDRYDAVAKGLRDLLERIDIIPAPHVREMLRSLNPWPEDEDRGGKTGQGSGRRPDTSVKSFNPFPEDEK